MLFPDLIHGRAKMRTTLIQLACLLTIVVLILSGCNLPVAEATAEVPAEIETSTATPKPTATPTEVPPTKTPAATATETLPAEPSATATVEIPTAEVVRETNCRTGPAGNYELVAKYPVGQMLQVVAKDLGAGYWFVQNPDKPDEQCWLLAQNIKISGDTSALPKFTPQPSPTAAPYFNVKFKKFDTCQGDDFAVFTVENVGSVPFRSAYIKVTDLRVNKSVETALHAFDQFVGCTLAKNIAPLNQGQTGYVNSPSFNWNARNNKLNAVIMLCTEQNLKGTCVQQSVAVKP
jgi:hypothetical protein